MMNKNGLYVILAILIIAWLGQLYWQAPEEEKESVTKELVSVSAKQTSENSNKNALKPVKKKPKEPQVVSPPLVSEAQNNKVDPSPNNNAAVIAEFQSSRRANYDRLSGYPEMASLLEQECGNLIDTELEHVVIDVSRLSGLDIFVSEHFCMASAILGKLNKIPSSHELRLKDHVNELQAAYDELLGKVEDNTTKVIVTKRFLNVMTKYYSVFPITDRVGSDRFQVAVLVLSPIRDAKRIFVWPMRFKLLNRHEIPQYVFKDVLDNVLPDIEAQINAQYDKNIAEIFAQQKLLFAQVSDQD